MGQGWVDGVGCDGSREGTLGLGVGQDQLHHAH